MEQRIYGGCKMEDAKEQNEKNLFLSFIVPVYNVEKYLRDCLDSLLTQNVEQGEYEIICVNDGSTDGSLAILCEYEKEYKNVRVVDKENGGVSSARNAGLQAAQGEYIWFVDGDDFIQSNCLKNVFSLLRANDYQIVKFQHRKVEETEHCLVTECATFSIKDKKAIMIGPCVWHMIICADLLFANNIAFREDMAYCEDALFQYYVWLHMSQEKCVEIDTVLYYYRKRSSSVSRIIDTDKITRQVCSFMQIAKIYQDEERVLTDKKQKKATKQRQYLAILNGLTYLPESTLDCQDTLKKLKEEKLYPFPFLWRHIFECRGVKGKLREFCRNLFKFKWIYLTYYKTARKNRIIKKHKESI